MAAMVQIVKNDRGIISQNPFTPLGRSIILLDQPNFFSYGAVGSNTVQIDCTVTIRIVKDEAVVDDSVSQSFWWWERQGVVVTT